MKRFLVLNGPNINFTGIREVGVYGAETFESILGYIRKEAERLGCEVTFFQSNHEGALIDALQQAHMDKLDGVVFNPGGYTHTSVALHDAIAHLDDKLRLPVVLHYMEGYRVDEIAKMLRLPSGTVKSRLMRARARLKDMLDDQEGGISHAKK